MKNRKKAYKHFWASVYATDPDTIVDRFKSLMREKGYLPLKPSPDKKTPRQLCHFAFFPEEVMEIPVSWQRPIDGAAYPRFHIYVIDIYPWLPDEPGGLFGIQLEFQLHIDLKPHSVNRWPDEKDMANEQDRLKQVFSPLVPS